MGWFDKKPKAPGSPGFNRTAHGTSRKSTGRPGFNTVAGAGEGYQGGRYFPRSDLSDRDRPKRWGSPFQPTIADKDILWMIRRDELAYHALEKRDAAVHFKWLHPWADSPELEESVTRLMSGTDTWHPDLKVKPTSSKTFKLSLGRGVSLVACGWEMVNADPTQPIDNCGTTPVPKGRVKGLQYLHAVPKSAIKEIHIDHVDGSATYGEVTHYTLWIPKGSGRGVTYKAEKFHSDWFIRVTNEFIDDNPWGISCYEPLFDAFTGKKNIDDAIVETVVQQAKMIPVMILEDDATDEEVAAARTAITDIHSKSWFVLPKRQEFKLVETDSSLNIAPHTSYILNNIAAGLVGSLFALTGSPQGTISTAETNSQEWYGLVGYDQRNRCDPWMRELNLRCQRYGLHPEGQFGWDWDKPWELDEKEWADVKLTEAKTALTTAAAVEKWKGMGHHMEAIDGDNFMVADDNPDIIIQLPEINTPRKRNGKKVKVKINKKKAKAVNVVTGEVCQEGVFLEPADREALKKLWSFKTENLERKMSGDMTYNLDLGQDIMLDTFRQLWEKHIGPAKATNKKGTRPNRNDMAAMYSEYYDLEPTIIKKGLKKLNPSITQYLPQTWEQEAIRTAGLMGKDLNISIWNYQNLPSYEVLQAEWNTIAKDSLTQNNRAVMQEIANGVRDGDDYRTINNRIADRFAKYNKGIPRTIQKHIHTAASRARWGVDNKYGGQGKMMYYTQQDTLVRDEHRAYDNTEVDENTAMMLMSQFGCRCYTVPITAYDRFLKERGYKGRQSPFDKVGA